MGSAQEVDDGLAGSLLKVVSKTDWGGYSGYLADVEGHPWELARNFFELRGGDLNADSRAVGHTFHVKRAT
ncbi:hypothetical protein DFAR_1590013 [Desulfarculales bacterium]